MNSRRAARREEALVAVLALAWLAATAGLRPLMLPDEGRYVGVAWEMLRSGDWLTPTLDGLPYFHKPPLFYWITAAAMALFGAGEWPARAAPLLGGWLGAMASYLFLRRWVEARVAQLALLALLAQPLFYVGAQFANLDMLVAGCITATVLLFAHAALGAQEGQRSGGALIAAYAMAALGVLAKGLIGVVLPGSIIVVWLLVRRRASDLRALLSWPGLALFVLIAAPWFIAMQNRFDGFVDYFFVVQHFKRFAAGGFNNAQPFWFFPALLALFTLPWWPWLRASLRRAYWHDPARGAVRLLMAVWAAAVVLFFSLPESKLVGYVFPALPALAFLAADGFTTMAQSPRGRFFWRAGLVLLAAVGVATTIVLTLRPPASSRELAGALRQQRAAAEPVFTLGNYPFDLPFYARLSEPVRVVDDWTGADVNRHDNWRKELADAGRFDTAANQAVLLTPSGFVRALCRAPVSWVIGAANAANAYPLLQQARVAGSSRGTTLWRVESTAAGCEGKAHADSPGL
jgi:4-amino-4-deoxy-L-arabinose transferase-like glycosyltransferase